MKNKGIIDIGVNKKWLLLPLLLTFHFSLFTANAQTHLFGAGPTRVLDTYLSHENFSGTGLTYLYIHEAKETEKHWRNLIEHEADYAATHDRSENISALEGDYNLYWGRYRHWTLIDQPSANGNTKTRLHLQAGGLANANLGFIYTLINTNNPTQVHASLKLMPSGIATYDFPLFRQQFSVRYELNIPLVGIMFSPNYGQSYYEIFGRGEYDHNVVPTTFVSAPTFRQMFTLEWRTGKKWNLQIGYLGNYQQAAVNNLKQHVYTHRVLIGITRRLAK